MNKLFRYFLSITLFITTFCYGLTKENNNIQVSSTIAVKSEFNLNTLYNGNHYSAFADDNFEYDPIYAKQQCPDIADQIISDVPPGQSPYLKPSDCEPDGGGDMNAQMMGGCDPLVHGEFGKLISNSVVIIYIPTDTGGSYCSGTVIGQKWVLSAAHCFVDPNNNQFYATLANKPAAVDNKYVVKTIYIPQNYNWNSAIKNDIAILELEAPLPQKYKPIKLAVDVPASGLKIPVWNAGYGGNQELRYRKQYFMTNIYDNTWPSGRLKHRNLNELYISGTIPTLDPSSNKMIAWQFTIAGDSGGPGLLYDSAKKEFTLLSINSYVFSCNMVAFLAKVPYNYSGQVSVPAYYHFIYNVINGTVNPNQVKAISIEQKYSALTLSQVENEIKAYLISGKSGGIHLVGSNKTENLPTAIATTSGYAFVTNYFDSSISRYKIKGNIISLENPLQLSDQINPTDIKIIGNYAFITSYFNKELLRYRIKSRGQLQFVDRQSTSSKPVSIATTNFHGLDYIFVANSGSASVSVYSFNPKTEEFTTINQNMRLDGFSGMPLKILANGPYLLVQGTQGISSYMFYGDEIEPKAFQPIAFDYKANNDMILLPGVKRPFTLLAVSSDISSLVEIYDVDFTDLSIHFNTFLPIKGTGMAAYLDVHNNIVLHVANAADYRQRTVSVFNIYPQNSIKEKINFSHIKDYETSNNPSKLEIQLLPTSFSGYPPGNFEPSNIAKR